MTILYILAGLYGLSLIAIIYCVVTAKPGVETEDGFCQFERGQAPDVSADIHGAGGGEIFIHYGGVPR